MLAKVCGVVAIFTCVILLWPKSEPSISDKIHNAVYYNIADLNASYEENEVATNNKIGHNGVQIKGMVQAIAEDFTSSPVIELITSNKYIPSRMYLNDDQRGRAGEIKKGTDVTFFCERTVYVVSAANGYECTVISY
ncbi:OB-fold protein [Enterobacter roggenkampii]|uniref:OB-fold protein n=1 Tax=Enterobacter roggenkampii TaxID=1812935 RepID=UPI001C7069E3|nr:hypothetical protein [Enterobacter roggenkampii]MBW9466546.1 hypothetical protein [Enterobacter roggenkampii]